MDLCMMSLPVWLPGPMFLPLPGGSLSMGSLSRGGLLGRGSLSRGSPPFGGDESLSRERGLYEGDPHTVKTRRYASNWHAFLSSCLFCFAGGYA